jgi:hypothetical protein
MLFLIEDASRHELPGCTCSLHLYLMLSLFEDASRHELPGCTCFLHLHLMLSLFKDASFSLEPDFSASYIGEILA